MLATLVMAFAAPTLVPQTRVTLDPPEGFVLSEQFPGFTDGAMASIAVTELRNVPASDLAPEMTAEALATKGMKELERAQVGGATLIRVEQTVQGVTVEKWMAIQGDEGSTVFVVGTMPAGDARLPSLRKALETVTLAELTSADVPEGMKYAITPGGGLAQAGTMGNMQMFTLGGKGPPLPDDEPRFMAGPSMGAADVEDLEAFARARLAGLPFEKARNVQVERVTVAGREGVELQALATHPKTRVDRMIYQLVLPGSGGTYFIAVGIGADRKEWKVFQEMGRSLRFDLD
ncbi:MAG: hypothetical protein KC656_18440 [Myxococcales bacterium]|nr:hypothetical protein [Myxococcales bacterium]